MLGLLGSAPGAGKSLVALATPDCPLSVDDYRGSSHVMVIAHSLPLATGPASPEGVTYASAC